LSGSENYLKIWFKNIRTKPTAHTFKQNAMGWTGFVVKINNKRIHFRDENDATNFYLNLISAIDDWNKKYPTLKKW
jgi:hypothetical protein